MSGGERAGRAPVRRTQPIALGAHGFNQLFRVGVLAQLLAQIADVGADVLLVGLVEVAGRFPFRIAQHFIEGLQGNRVAVVAHQEAQVPALDGCQPDIHVRVPRLVLIGVERKVQFRKFQDLRQRLPAAPDGVRFQLPADNGQQFLFVVPLAVEVQCAPVQGVDVGGVDLLLGCLLPGNDDHKGVSGLVLHAIQQFEAVDAGELDVQDHHAGLVQRNEPFPLLGAVATDDADIGQVAFQEALGRTPKVAVIVNQNELCNHG